MNIYYSDIPSPVGKWNIIASEKGIHFIGPPQTSIEYGLNWLKKSVVIDQVIPNQNYPVIKIITASLNSYFQGKELIFDSSLILFGTPFQNQVWNEIAKIPHGQTKSYKQIATALGKPNAIRAVGTACGKNPVLLLIPCHRVIASNGTMGGYAGGLDIKKWLLELEKN